MDNNNHFAHSLLFRCGKCGSPVAIGILVEDRGLEAVDANSFALECPCGWSGQAMGAQARRHWVVSWHRTEVDA